MNRDRATALLTEYLEGNLPEETRNELEAYLATDELARRDLEALRKTVASLSNLQPLNPRPGFARRVETRIKRRSRGRFFAQGLAMRLPFEWFSFLIIVALLLLYLLIANETPLLSPTPDAETGTDAALSDRPAEQRSR